MMWETAARKAIEAAVADAEFDQASGIIKLRLGYDHRGDRKWMEFSDFEEIDRELTNLGESE